MIETPDEEIIRELGDKIRRYERVLNWISHRFEEGLTARSSRDTNTVRTVNWALGKEPEPSQLFKEWSDANT